MSRTRTRSKDGGRTPQKPPTARATKRQPPIESDDAADPAAPDENKPPIERCDGQVYGG